MKTAIIFAALVSVALSGIALAQTHNHSAEMKQDTISKPGSTSENSVKSDQMKKDGPRRFGGQPTPNQFWSSTWIDED
jgi:pentapeptide MXKDX repeat protein